MKTIKQIADEIGVSKQAVRNQIANLGLQSKLQVNGNTFAIDFAQENLIKQAFLKKSQTINANVEKFCVYKHTVPNGKIYIGITSLNPHARWNSGNGYKQNEAFYSDIQEYGWNEITHAILYDNLSFRQAEIEESRLILEYKSYKPEYGYNKQYKLINEFEQSQNKLSTLQSTLIVVLQKELDIKNEQIRELNARLAEANAAIITAQRSAHAEQVLHADTKGILPSGNQEREKQGSQITVFFTNFWSKWRKSNRS